MRLQHELDALRAEFVRMAPPGRAAFYDAKPQSQNGFKVELAKRCLVYALKQATQSA